MFTRFWFLLCLTWVLCVSKLLCVIPEVVFGWIFIWMYIALLLVYWVCCFVAVLDELKGFDNVVVD